MKNIELEKLSTEELKGIANNPLSCYKDIITASIVLTDRELAEGRYYTLEQVFGNKI